MKDGKNICKHLKAIRREIADQNNIPLVQEECHHEGNCQGTCPRCEQEVHYLESELIKRSRLGKAASIIGLAAGLSLASCNTPDLVGVAPQPLEGDPYWEPDTTTVDSLSTCEPELQGFLPFE